MEVNKDLVLKALSHVQDPDLRRDIVSLNMVKDIKIENKNIFVKVNLTTPACPLKDNIKTECVNEIRKVVGDEYSIQVEMGSTVTSHINEMKEKLLPGVKNTIAVASGKGGVGKSTVAVNLAVALAKDGASVGLIDADIYGPSIPLMLGVKDQPQMVGENPNTAKLIPLESYGVKLMSIGFLIDNDTPVIWRGPMASGAIKQFMTDVLWGDLDYLIFDLPPGTGDIQLTLVQTIPLTGAVIVTTPQDVALIDARKALRMFQRVNVTVLGLIENMSYFIAPDTGKRYEIFGSGGGKKAAEEMGIPFLGDIPINPLIRVGGDTGKPIVIADPNCEESKKIMEIARNMAAQISIRNINAPVIPKIEILNP